MVVRPWSAETADQNAFRAEKDRDHKPQRQKIPWEMPQPKKIKLTARYEALGAARAALELEADKPGRYRFGPLRWEVVEGDGSRLHRTEKHTLYGPTVIGWLQVTYWLGDWKSGGRVTAFVFDRGVSELGSWHWGAAEEPAGPGVSAVRSSVTPPRLEWAVSPAVARQKPQPREA